MTPRERQPQDLASIPDDQIDYSDIPELDEVFWKKACLVEPDRTPQKHD